MGTAAVVQLAPVPEVYIKNICDVGLVVRILGAEVRRWARFRRRDLRGFQSYWDR